MAACEILLLGNPKLLEKSVPVEEAELEYAISVGIDLRDTMEAFRSVHGWGRAIASPQIGVMKQIVYMELDKPQLFINPVLSYLSTEMIELWDDCMSFPDILVKVRRHQSCRIAYRDETWREYSHVIKGDESELLQHEIDHLHGILATMRAIDGSKFALQSQRHLLDRTSFTN